MISEIIWSLVGTVWLVISVYIAYLIFKFGKSIFKSLTNIKSMPGLNNLSEITKTIEKLNNKNNFKK